MSPQDRRGQEAGAIRGDALGERQDWQKREWSVSKVVIPAAIVAAVRLPCDDISGPSPRVLSVVADSVSLAKLIFDRVVR
jgi:hypothetical protein